MDPEYFARLKWREPAPPNYRELVQNAIKDCNPTSSALRQVAQYSLDEPQLHHLGRAFIKARASGAAWNGSDSFRLAILSNCTVGHLIPPIIATALRYGINLDVLGFSYNEAFTVAVGGDDRLAEFAPDAVLVAVDYRGLPLREAFGREGEEQKVINDCNGYLQAMFDGVRTNTGSVCFAQTIALAPAYSFGHADKKLFGSVGRIIDGVNRFIANTADVVLDIASLAGIVGTAQWFDAKLFHTGKIPFAITFVPLYADHVCRVIGAMRGKSRRVLVLDLDNTLWGGVVGDDGVAGLVIGNGSAGGEAFLDFQRKAISLRKRGVLLAVSSKNDDEQARRPFREIPDMVLKEDSFSAFHANWNDKAANIQAISEELALGLDTFVFVDDNPYERALVRKFLPEVAVPEMPDDPSCYSLVLDCAGYFEAISFSDEDMRRADMYQTRGAMAQLAPHDLEGYLASLEMKLVVENVNSGNRARVVQLINKSNQFNLTARRFTEPEVRDMEADTDFKTFAIRLVDKHDDHGIISVLLCKKSDDALNIILWVMSCRVIGRGVEKAVLRFLVGQATRSRVSCIRGEYIPTARNRLVEKHYANLGFSQDSISEQGAITWSLHLDGADIGANTQLHIIDNTA